MPWAIPPTPWTASPPAPKCGDTGWNGTEMCSCLKQLCTQEQIQGTHKPAQPHRGTIVRPPAAGCVQRPAVARNGSLPPGKHDRVVAVCEGFARQFPSYPLKNLLLSGGTGLGKTFLSGCIAREVSERGFSVVYDTAISLFAAFESRKFSRDMEEGRQARDETRRYLHCDLLILDDLGSELTTPFVQSALYELINSRLLADKRTIISTNLSIEQIAARYTPQIASRIEDCSRNSPSMARTSG